MRGGTEVFQEGAGWGGVGAGWGRGRVQRVSLRCINATFNKFCGRLGVALECQRECYSGTLVHSAGRFRSGSGVA